MIPETHSFPTYSKEEAADAMSVLISKGYEYVECIKRDDIFIIRYR